MKKNIMMRLSALLLVAVLLTTCVISGTFAKYVTTGTATDSARVAKWGVTVEAKLDDLFVDEYKLDDTTNYTAAFNKKDIEFLCDLFARSRSKEDNIIILNQIPNQIIDYNKTYLLGLLGDKDLLEKFDLEDKKVM